MIISHPGISRVCIYIFIMNIIYWRFQKMTFEEWKEQNRRDEITATEIVRIERDLMREFDQCKDMNEKIQKYEELYKKLDDNGDYERMKYLWKVAHKLNIRIKK